MEILMRKAGLLFSLAFCLLLVNSITAFAAPPNHFDSDNEAWQQSQVDIKTTSYQYEYYWPTGDALWRTENGNGFIYLESTPLARPRAYNAMVTGDDAQMGDLNGKTLIVDLKRMGADFKTLAGSEPTVRWVITDADVVQTFKGTWYVSKLAVSPKLNQLTGEWETHEIEMKPENFFLWPWGLTGDQAAPFNEVMVNYKQVGLSIISNAPDDAAFGWGPADGNILYTLPDYGGFSSVAGTNSVLAIDNFGTAAPSVPTLNEWGIIIFALLAGFIAIRQIRRNSHDISSI